MSAYGLGYPMLDRLKFWLLIGLLISNLAVGLISLYFLNSVGERYGSLIDRSVPLLNSLRTLTRELGAVQRLARRVIDPENEPGWAQLVEQMDEGSNKARLHGIEISAMELVRDSRHSAHVAQHSRSYDEKADAFLNLVHAKRFEDANRFNNETLRPAYEEYMRALDNTADYVQQQGADLRERYSQDSRIYSGFLLAFAGWPLLAGALAVIVMIILLVVLIISVLAPGLGWRKPVGPPAGPS